MMRRILMLALALLSVPAGLVGQDLERAERFAFSGRAEEARTALEGWWDASWDEANRLDRQRALRLRALLTVDPAIAELDYQRLVIEYPGGPYSDEALMRLGSVAAARADYVEATGRFEALLRDYPESEYRSLAEAWLAGNAPVMSEQPDWTVQVGAFSSADRARTLASTLEASGFSSRLVLVEGSQLLRVRIGRYTSEDEARRVRQALVDGGFDARVVSDVARETPAS
jgi:sporulation related protein